GTSGSRSYPQWGGRPCPARKAVTGRSGTPAPLERRRIELRSSRSEPIERPPHALHDPTLVEGAGPDGLPIQPFDLQKILHHQPIAKIPDRPRSVVSPFADHPEALGGVHRRAARDDLAVAFDLPARQELGADQAVSASDQGVHPLVSDD